MSEQMRRLYYVDTSVLLRALVDGSSVARDWFTDAHARADRFVASRLLELETRRVLKNAGRDDTVARPYLDAFVLVTLTDDLLDDAIGITEPLGGADSLHIATALRVGADVTTIVTHDRQMAAAGVALGFTVIDPVTDDPRRGPVV